MADGTILWQGTSELDGFSPIAVIATGLKKSSKNEKTGGMVQVYIIRTDIEPHTAVKLGIDGAVCGDCKHRDGSCYVLTFQGPLNVFKAYERGKYDRAEPGVLAGRRVRLGTYGDPAAVPMNVWISLLQGAAGWTGYTHQWHKCDPSFRYLLMASVDTPEEYIRATGAGWRTFRTRQEQESLLGGEISCPASKEAGHRTQCEDCLLCDGSADDQRRNIAIVAHGPTFKVHAYNRMREKISRLPVITS